MCSRAAPRISAARTSSTCDSSNDLPARRRQQARRLAAFLAVVARFAAVTPGAPRHRQGREVDLGQA